MSDQWYDRELKKLRSETKNLETIIIVSGDILKTLKTENKALKEKWKNPAAYIREVHKRVETLKESRDELLNELKSIFDNNCFDPPTINIIIQKAEGQKKKEQL